MQTLFYSVLNISAKCHKIDPSNYTVSKLVRFLRHSVIIKKFNRYSKEKKQQYHA